MIDSFHTFCGQIDNQEEANHWTTKSEKSNQNKKYMEKTKSNYITKENKHKRTPLTYSTGKMTTL